MSWRQFIPRYKSRSIPGGRASSFRWGSLRWDSLKSPKGFTFAQYGGNPALFVCKITKEAPTFLYGMGWETRYANKDNTWRIGNTKKPLNFSWLWGKGGKNAPRTRS